MMGEYQRLSREFGPEFDKESNILLLGSFPSVKSREQAFFYGHPQNRFWKVLAAVYDSEVPGSVEEKKAFLHANHIALWDVIQSCDIIGSADSSIKNVEVTELELILSQCNIQNIFVNGKTAAKLYHKYSEPKTLIPAIILPSTSPANAMYSLDRLVQEWSVIRQLKH